MLLLSVFIHFFCNFTRHSDYFPKIDVEYVISILAPAQTKDPHRNLRLEVGLFVTDELVKEFGEKYVIDKLTNPGVTTEKVFKATLLTNYIAGVSIYR